MVPIVDKFDIYEVFDDSSARSLSAAERKVWLSYVRWALTLFRLPRGQLTNRAAALQFERR